MAQSTVPSTPQTATYQVSSNYGSSSVRQAVHATSDKNENIQHPGVRRQL